MNHPSFENRADRIEPKRVLFAVIRTALLFSLYALLCSIMSMPLMREDFLINDVINVLVVIPPILLMTNSLFLNFAYFDRSERVYFLSTAVKPIDPKAEKRKILRSPYFWIELTLFVIGMLLIPASWLGFDAILAPFNRIAGFAQIPKWPFYILLYALDIEFVFFVSLGARASARVKWTKKPEFYFKPKRYKSKAHKAYSYLRMIQVLAFTSVLYALAPAILTVVVGILISFGKIILVLLAEPLFFWLFVIILVALTMQLLRIRGKYLKKLSRFCQKNGYTLVKKYRFFTVLFFHPKGYSFSIQTEKETYCCRLIAQRFGKMEFSSDGTYSQKFMLHMPMPLVTRGARGHVQAIDRGNGDDRELFGYSRSFDYRFEADGKKILILNPVPRRVTYVVEDASPIELDNGSRVGEDYEVWTGNAFLRLLEREKQSPLDY